MSDDKNGWWDTEEDLLETPVGSKSASKELLCVLNSNVARVLWILLFTSIGILCGLTGNVTAASLATCVLAGILSEISDQRLIEAQREYIKNLEKAVYNRSIFNT